MFLIIWHAIFIIITTPWDCVWIGVCVRASTGEGCGLPDANGTDYSQYKYPWKTPLEELISPVSTAVMKTHFDRACHIKQYFTHAAPRLASEGKGNSYEGSRRHITYYHLRLWQDGDVIRNHFFFKNPQFTLSFIGCVQVIHQCHEGMWGPVGQFFLGSVSNAIASARGNYARACWKLHYLSHFLMMIWQKALLLGINWCYIFGHGLPESNVHFDYHLIIYAISLDRLESCYVSLKHCLSLSFLYCALLLLTFIKCFYL